MVATEVGTGFTALGVALDITGVFKRHINTSIGDNDLPVVITVLNTYSD